MKLLSALLFSFLLAIAAAAQPCGLTLIVLSTNTAPCGECASSIQVDGTGGTPPYSFVWSTGDTGSTASGLCPGTYTCTVTDIDSCVSFGAITITSPGPPLVSAFVTMDASCNDTCCDGSADVNVGGGTPPYTYAWSSGSVTDTALGLCAGKYVVCVTDAAGCTTCDTVEIESPAGMEDEAGIKFSLYPNPADDLLNIDLPETTCGAEIRIYNTFGELAGMTELKQQAGILMLDITHLPPGIYFVEISLDGKRATRKFLKA